MDPCPLDMFHDPRNQDIFPVTYCIHLYFLALQIFIHQDRMILHGLIDNPYEFVDILVADGNLHPLPAQNIGRPYQYRIPKF